MAEKDTTTQLPAPLSLTLDEAARVSGGVALTAVSVVPHWLWFGQPPVTSLTGLTTVAVP
jgi:hypothetical protein